MEARNIMRKVERPNDTIKESNFKNIESKWKKNRC